MKKASLKKARGAALLSFGIGLSFVSLPKGSGFGYSTLKFLSEATLAAAGIFFIAKDLRAVRRIF